MALSPGARLGPDEVIAKLGEGGMGEVYRARDTKLHRDVAIKILPAVFAADAERLARFQREAQLLASLNHPHIAQIHGFEDSQIHALVMEFVDGPTLAARIAAIVMARANRYARRRRAGRRTASNEAGSRQVFVRPYPGPGGRWQVSTAGGTAPVWSRARPELLFRGTDGRVMTAVYVADGNSFRSERPLPWMEGVSGPIGFFDLHPDGQRVAAAPLQTEADRLDTVAFVFNFFDELRRIARASP